MIREGATGWTASGPAFYRLTGGVTLIVTPPRRERVGEAAKLLKRWWTHLGSNQGPADLRGGIMAVPACPTLFAFHILTCHAFSPDFGVFHLKCNLRLRGDD